MNFRESQSKGRLRLRHLLEVTEAIGEEMEAERARFDRLADPNSAPRVVSAFNLFQTTEPLADQVVSMFQTFGRTLEPSAGLGRLYRAVRKVSADCEITLVEQSADCCRELYLATEQDRSCRLIQGDFLQQSPERLGAFDSIVMNPPFKMGTDIQHIRHALSFVARGGRLVSICAAGEKRRKAFCGDLGGEMIALPPCSFRECGTNVDTAIVVFNR